MGKTIQVAADREADPTKTVLPAEVARGVYIRNPPSAQALKLMHLLIAKAGGRMADDVQHEFRLSEIRKISGMKNHDRASLEPLIADLAAVVLVHDDMEKKRITISGIIDEGVIDYRHEISGDLLVTWTFRRAFQRMAAESNHWAIVDRQTVFALSSKYAILLFQHIASLAKMDHVHSKIFTIPELRDLLGVPVDKLDRFSNLSQKALKPAIAEINQISRLDLIARPRKIGRTIASVEICWAVKGSVAKDAAARELKGHSAGRKARRGGTAETAITEPAFPETGGIAYSLRWKDIKRASGCNVDDSKIATDFRRFLAERNISRSAANVETLFGDFCRKIGKV